MIYIEKGEEPSELKAHRVTYMANYDNFRDKDAVKKSLLEEQGYLCAYCMSSIGSDRDWWCFEVGIEHYKSQDDCPNEQLKYENMLAVCKVSEGKCKEEQHCDVSRGKKPFNINPQNKDHINTLSYSEGRISSKNQQYNTELNEILGLNRSYLPNNRRETLNQAIMLLRKYYKESTDRLAAIKKVIHIYDSKDKQGRKKAYCGIVLEYFGRFL